MQYSNTHILLDIHAPDAQLCIPLHQGDTGQILVIRLTDRGEAYPIGPDCTAVLAARKADGMSLLGACTILGDGIHYALSPQTTAAPGLVEAELRLYGDGDFLLTSPRFHLLVQASPVSDGEVSGEEQSALTTLISQTRSLNETVEEKLSAGAFLPQFSIGSVQTLPSGSDASVSLSGSGEEPVLNFGIPMGPQGQAESLIPDTALSESSLKPVQNKVIKAALDRKADKAETEAALEKLESDTETALSQKADAAETEAALAGKVDKVSGKGLSQNDFTDAYKSKLTGIEAGANKYVLPAGGVGSSHLANTAVTEAKIAAGAVSRAKLATNALYSPFVNVTGAHEITAANIGMTLKTSWNDATAITITQENSVTMPDGVEIAVYRNSPSAAVTIIASGVRLVIPGETAFLTDATVKMSESFGMIALKKVGSNSTTGDAWLITGNVEVVE